MELILRHQTDSQISVDCDSKFSHAFDLCQLTKEPSRPFADVAIYGRILYQALFPAGTSAQITLDGTIERLLLVTTDSNLDEIIWEYTYGPNGFLVLDRPFVRGVPADQRINPPLLEDSLRIVAIPSHPLSREIEPLDIDEEWMRLKEIIEEMTWACTLERTRPSTVEQMGSVAKNEGEKQQTWLDPSCSV
jgi:hypothetical protein